MMGFLHNTSSIDEANLIALDILENLGIMAPSQEQIDFIENLLKSASTNVSLELFQKAVQLCSNKHAQDRLSRFLIPKMAPYL